VKLVRCNKGSLFDVIVDLRKDSPTFLKWVGIELTAANHRMLYIPKLFAHGFQTLEDDTEIFYQMSEFYEPAAARGIRWNDPNLGINWPDGGRTMSQKDQAYPNVEVNLVGL
jgi:dTDP-4-dehydrorhamnose 3,5-epimerase